MYISQNETELFRISPLPLLSPPSELRSAARDFVDAATGRVLIAAADWPHYRLRIDSHNNFPTAAGLASSASGFACLTQVGTEWDSQGAEQSK